MSNVERLSPPAPVAMADEYFNFATPEHFWVQWRHQILLRAIRRAGPIGRALEIGCGHGIARELLERDAGFVVDGSDLNERALAMAKQGRGRLFVYNILEPQASMLGQYDAVFLLDVIEHIADDTAFLSAAVRHLRPGGFVFVNVPANEWLFSDYDRVQGHVRRYSARTLQNLFRRCGVELCKIEPWALSMVPLLVARKFLVRGSNQSETMRRGFMPPNQAAEWLMHSLKDIEVRLHFRMPAGTSLLAWGRSPNPTSQ
jgi:SAM-dependent methyltransferase